jgi:hypothetical protein|tara:strand:+ start:317 stop:523 length:207 start_codon:yes stop_codon:yes gene_type:complete
MHIYTKHTGKGKNKSIDVIVENWDSRIIEDVVPLNKCIDKELIQSLRDVANELEEYNEANYVNRMVKY